MRWARDPPLPPPTPPTSREAEQALQRNSSSSSSRSGSSCSSGINSKTSSSISATTAAKRLQHQHSNSDRKPTASGAETGQQQWHQQHQECDNVTSSNKTLAPSILVLSLRHVGCIENTKEGRVPPLHRRFLTSP